MMDIVRTIDGDITARLEPVEVDLLRLATGQLVDLLTEAQSDPVAADTDPAIRRLLPDAYLSDPEAAAEFRRYTAGDLVAGKIRNAGVVLACLDEAEEGDSEPDDSETDDSETDGTTAVPLSTEQVLCWLRTLTDLRLTLATRLKISADGRIGLRGNDAAFLTELYEWLGMVQESLVYAIDA